MIRVIVLDERPIMRNYLRLLLDGSKWFTLVSALPELSEAEEVCRRCKPGLIILNASGRDGECRLDTAETVKQRFPETKLVLVSEYPEKSWLRRGEKLGADGFWFTEREDDFLLFLTRVMEGSEPYPVSVPEVSIGNARSGELSQRELDVLRELLTGEGNIEIARHLGIQPETVKFHIRSMLQKTGFHTRTELAVRARCLGIVV